MICAAEIAMLVFGIITLAKGRFKLSRRKVVVGGPAYLIGVLLLLPLTISFVIGLVLGAAQISGGGTVNLQDTDQLLMYAGVELAVVVGVLSAALVVAAVRGKDPSALQGPEQYPYSPNAPRGASQDPGNPYSAPQNDPNKPRQS